MSVSAATVHLAAARIDGQRELGAAYVTYWLVPYYRPVAKLRALVHLRTTATDVAYRLADLERGLT